jgi:transcriptional regulator with XRE-family HTH domain
MKKSVATWLNEQFLKWAMSQGKRKSVKEFAEYLEVPQASLSSWMSGAYLPAGKNILKIAAKLGSEIFAIMDIETSSPLLDPAILELSTLWRELSDKDKADIKKIIARAKSKK